MNRTKYGVTVSGIEAREAIKLYTPAWIFVEVERPSPYNDIQQIIKVMRVSTDDYDGWKWQIVPEFKEGWEDYIYFVKQEVEALGDYLEVTLYPSRKEVGESIIGGYYEEVEDPYLHGWTNSKSTNILFDPSWRSL